jgi:dimethylglycine dehydrogenase
VFDSSLFADSTDDITEVAARAMAHVPILGEVGIAEFINGPITYSPDANPLIGPAPGVHNFYQAVGVQIGITHAAAAGKVLTELITDGDTEWDVWPWDPRRFGEWAFAGSRPDGGNLNNYANSRVRDLYEHQYAEPFPHRIWESARPVNQSPLYDTLAAKGARFGQIAGWERAFWFGGEPYSHATLSYRDEHWHEAVAAECGAVRDNVGVMDHGGFSRFEVSGPDAAAFLDRMFCTRLPAVGRVRLAHMLRPNGTVWSEATIARFDDDRFLLLGPTAARERDFDWLSRHLVAHADGESVDLRYGTERTSTLMVMGPRSRDLLARLSDADVSREAAPWMSLREIEVAGVAATALRVSFVGELGWELHVDDDDLVELYLAIHAAGADLGLRDFGSYALNAMRIEKGYHGWGSEFGVEYTPFDAGLERFVDFDKPDFIGQGAALVQADKPAAWSYGTWTVGIESIPGSPGDPAPSAPIRIDGRPVGFVTSASMGFRTGHRVCLGYVEGRYAEVRDGFTIDGYGVDCPARRHDHAVYDPEDARPRG